MFSYLITIDNLLEKKFGLASFYSSDEVYNPEEVVFPRISMKVSGICFNIPCHVLLLISLWPLLVSLVKLFFSFIMLFN